jgi:hypothetical protein
LTGHDPVELSVPVVINVSKRFYESFGQENTDELVNVLNTVDANYRDEFRDLFAAHFGTLRAEMATVRAEMQTLKATMEGRLDTFEQRIEGRLKGLKSELVMWIVGLWFVSVALPLLIKAWNG